MSFDAFRRSHKALHLIGHEGQIGVPTPRRPIDGRSCSFVTRAERSENGDHRPCQPDLALIRGSRPAVIPTPVRGAEGAERSEWVSALACSDPHLPVFPFQTLSTSIFHHLPTLRRLVGPSSSSTGLHRPRRPPSRPSDCIHELLKIAKRSIVATR